MPELLARVDALLRRRPDRGRVGVTVGLLRVDPLGRRAVMDGRTLELTGREFELLEVLARHAGMVLTRTQLLEQVWGYTLECRPTLSTCSSATCDASSRPAAQRASCTRSGARGSCCVPGTPREGQPAHVRRRRHDRGGGETLALVLIVVVSTFAGSERRALDQRLVERATATASAAGGPPSARLAPPSGGRPGPPAALPPLSRRIEQTVAQGGESTRLLRNGAVVGTYGAALPDPRFPSPGGTGSVESVRVGGVTYRAIAVEAEVTADGGQRSTARLELAASLDDVESRISDLRRRVLLVGHGGLVVATGLALLLIRVALRSLDRLRGGIAMGARPR